MASTVQKWGNSLGIRIPKSVAEQMGVSDGSQVELETQGQTLTIRPRRKQPKSLASLLDGFKGANPHGEIHADSRRGRELI